MGNFKFPCRSCLQQKKTKTKRRNTKLSCQQPLLAQKGELGTPLVILSITNEKKTMGTSSSFDDGVLGKNTRKRGAWSSLVNLIYNTKKGVQNSPSDGASKNFLKKRCEETPSSTLFTIKIGGHYKKSRFMWLEN